ncbi:hypothetical protein FRC01_001328 [Tulasnella sp. 417]|nr:hypothetical protein FRC01_001328 [Tulasnella sp. 417]
MRSLGHNLTEAEVEEMITHADLDGTGAIVFDEFLTMMVKTSGGSDPGEDRIKEVFTKFDVDGNGHINAAELKQAMDALGEKISEDDLNQMIREADADGDGLINYEEFKKMMEST